MNVALLGFGTVGRGVEAIISEQLNDVRVTRILELPDRLSDKRMTADFQEIADDATIDVVMECMGGIEPAHTFIAQALRANKHVITSNKAVVAAHFDEFVSLANEHGVGFFIEASVAGGIPWIASIAKVRRIDAIGRFSGIMNGTTNYIIYSMLKDNIEFKDALEKAQELGYAERDPSADIDGIDVANKTIISASVAFDVRCTRDLPVSGIRNLTKRDLDLFGNHSRSIKLLGRGIAKDGRYAVAVEPVAIMHESLEAHVPSNFNLVTLEGGSVGELKYYGQGAGMMPTGNAMVQDLLDCKAGIQPSYAFNAGLVYDPDLLTSDYVIRCAEQPQGSSVYEPGAWLISSVSAKKAHSVLQEALKKDATAFMAAIE